MPLCDTRCPHSFATRQGCVSPPVRSGEVEKGELTMHTIVRFLTALRQRTDQETLEEFVILCLRRLLDREDGELRRMLVHPHLK